MFVCMFNVFLSISLGKSFGPCCTCAFGLFELGCFLFVSSFPPSPLFLPSVLLLVFPLYFFLCPSLFPSISSIFHFYSLKAFTKFEIGPQETECRTAAFRHSVSWSPIGPFHAHSIVVATTTVLSPHDTVQS